MWVPTPPTPHADRLADADLPGAHHRTERRRHRVGQDRGLFERDVVRHSGQADGLSDGVLGPCAVVGERHQLNAQTVRDVAAAAVRTGGAGPAGGHDHPVAFGPAGDACAKGGDRS
jgi:hypothetical protein